MYTPYGYHEKKTPSIKLLNSNENKNDNNINSVCLAVKTYVDRALYSARDRVRCENSRRGRDSARIIVDHTRLSPKIPPTGLLQVLSYGYEEDFFTFVCLFSKAIGF